MCNPRLVTIRYKQHFLKRLHNFKGKLLRFYEIHSVLNTKLKDMYFHKFKNLTFTFLWSTDLKFNWLCSFTISMCVQSLLTIDVLKLRLLRV